MKWYESAINERNRFGRVMIYRFYKYFFVIRQMNPTVSNKIYIFFS